MKLSHMKPYKSLVVRLVTFLRNRCRYDLVTRTWIRASRGEAAWMGSMECGWLVPHQWPAAGSVCYCFGAGEDISFDVALARDRGYQVHTFDPTPRAIAHYRSLPDNERAAVTFHAFGIWTEDKVMQFFAPADVTHVSHSLVLPLSNQTGFSAECLSFRTILVRLGGAVPQLVKMDIEGAEMYVIENLLTVALPEVFLVEFDELTPLTSSRNWLRVRAVAHKLLTAGYDLFAVDRTNYTFVRRAATAATR
jgi:FkbM family methyltransferase